MVQKRNKSSQKINIPESQVVIIGRHPVLEALSGDRRSYHLHLQKDIQGDLIDQVISLAQKQGVPVSFYDKKEMDRCVKGNHQGFILMAEPINYATLDDLFDIAEERQEVPFFVLLDGLEDPHNLGAILRTADAAGVHGIIIPSRRAVGLTSTVVKTAAGAAEHVRVVQVTNMARTIEELQDRGVWVFGTDMAGEDYRQWNSAGPIAIVIGSEGKGISRLVKEKCDGLVTIPMKGHVQSLNASVAAALLMYEVARKR